MTKNIATAYVRFIQTAGSKRRPVFIIRETEDQIVFFNITTKYQNKSDYVKQWYFEIEDYKPTGLNKHSWIDTFKPYAISKKSPNKIKYIGELSDSDISRLVNFLRKIKSKR